MVQSRILEIDYKTNFIRYYYQPHEDNHLPESERKGSIEVFEHVFDFIKKLIIHIPDHQFKTIRYFGLYSSKGRKRMPNYQKKSSFLRPVSSLKWRFLVLKTFKYDILKCRCGAIMQYCREESYFL